MKKAFKNNKTHTGETIDHNANINTPNWSKPDDRTIANSKFVP